MRYVFFAIAFFISSATIALAQAVTPDVCTGILCQVMGKFPEINAWLIAIFTFLGITLRASSELLAFLAVQLDKSDHGWAVKLASWSMWCAKVIGWFGGGQSKKVFEWYAPEAPVLAPAPAPIVK